MSDSPSWNKIFQDYNILSHDFNKSPFYINSDHIKHSVQGFTKTAQKEVRLLCKHDTSKSRPDIMINNNLFILPVKNGEYAIIKGNGYVKIPDITTEAIPYQSKLQFKLDSATYGDSEMLHIDYAFATGLIKDLLHDPNLQLTIRGKKYTKPFSFYVGNNFIKTNSAQVEVDAGYESDKNIVLIEGKNKLTQDTIIRQLFYPYKQWLQVSKKNIIILFFEKRKDEYLFWGYKFTDKNDYNSIKLIYANKFKIIE